MDFTTTLRGAIKIQLHVRADGADSSSGFDALGAPGFAADVRRGHSP